MKNSQPANDIDDLSLILKIGEAIATISDREGLYQLIFSELQKIFNFEIAGISILDKKRTHLEVYMAGMYTPSKFQQPPIRREKIQIADSPFNEVMQTMKCVRMTLDLMLKTARFEDDLEAIKVLGSLGIKEILISPMLIRGELIGFLLIGSVAVQSIPDNRIAFLQKIVNQVALSVKLNIAYDEVLQRENIKNILLLLNNALASVKERDHLFFKLVQEINNIISLTYLGINIVVSEHNDPITACYVKKPTGEFTYFANGKFHDLPISMLKSQAHQTGQQLLHEFKGDSFSTLCRQSVHFRALHDAYGVKAVYYSSFKTGENSEINIVIAKTNSIQMLEWETEFINQFVPQLSFILKNYLAFEEISFLKKQLEQEKIYLLEEINLNDNFHEIIGNGPAMQSVLFQIKQVAPLISTVLIQGETGTGKELAARAIHNLSNRKDQALVKLNCAALPAQLIESELFGHEKGSFTGAIERRIGKFELANGGTIFLDEIGEMPLELQSKLLRVLQENEFERIGGKGTLHTDIRIIAATNRQLEKEVEQGRFRSDLYFRLNVFPITMPPLRNRTEDIPLFVKYFMEKYSKRVGKIVNSIRKNSLEALKDYYWPGNIRELEHMIERAVIVSTSSTIELDEFAAKEIKHTEPESGAIKPLIEMEREYIVNALKRTKGQVTGEKGAAALLGLNGKTLGSRMRKLGIKREIHIM